MRILYSNSAKTWGGNEFWCKNSINSLANRGHELAIAVRSNIFDGKLHPDVKILKLPFKHELDRTTSQQLKRFILDHNIQLLLPTKRKDYFILGRLAKKLHRKCIFRLGIMREVPVWDLPQRYVYNSLPDAIIVNARKIKDVLIGNRLSSDEKIHVIYNGYNFPKLELCGLNYAIDKSKFAFALAGRLGPQKGIDIALEAVKILASIRNDFIVYIAGEGTSRQVYETFINTNQLADHVKLLGHIDNVRELFFHSDCILIPSRNEGIPNALFEAWSLKKPVIVSDQAGIPEAVSNLENGLIVGLDPDKLANAMGYSMRFRDFASQLGEYGYQTMTTRFSLDSMTDKLEHLFKGLMQ